MHIYRGAEVPCPRPTTLRFPAHKATYTFSELIRNSSLHRRAFEVLQLLSSRAQATENKYDGYTTFTLRSGGCLLFNSNLNIIGYDDGSHFLDLSQIETKRCNRAA